MTVFFIAILLLILELKYTKKSRGFNLGSFYFFAKYVDFENIYLHFWRFFFENRLIA